MLLSEIAGFLCYALRRTVSRCEKTIAEKKGTEAEKKGTEKLQWR